ncbi:PREDICTED: P2X purinoceptor 6 [Nipponia nippon]|uniref:P2X purinoceptor 6 n=1 Tax=Nipponia nippon TaxID=128390 RepID=UPI000510CB40|nr:PREDICTED: P2X purinoceptor 6 [Nipponia nippon]
MRPGTGSLPPGRRCPPRLRGKSRKGAAVAEVGGAGRRLWDAADYAQPPQGENVLFLVTNFIATPKQAQGTCPESPSVLDAMCTEDADCPMGNPVVRGNGIKTGKCVMFNTTHSTCEIYGWCPVENNTLPGKPLLAEAENFTLFIKNTVHFTKFNFSKCNTLQTNDPTYFKSCTYDPFFNPSCPVFRVRDMVEAAGETFGDLALMGGSIGVRIDWDCDLDHPAAQCQPQYSFSLQDRRYNFRTASYYWDSQRQLYRNLLKLYGIRFDISVHGQAGKLSIIPAAVSFGTGIAFFGAATVVCDLVLLYLDAKADFYWKEKFEEAKPPKGLMLSEDKRSPGLSLGSLEVLNPALPPALGGVSWVQGRGWLGPCPWGAPGTPQAAKLPGSKTQCVEAQWGV